MIRNALFGAGACLCVGLAGFASRPTLDPLLKAVENRYNRIRTLKLDFSESYTGPHRVAQSESGVLYLSKPGRMRWNYAQPSGKFFLSDGKSAYLYSPDAHQVEKSQLKESEDMRAPLAFLLGKLNFWKEFRQFGLQPDPAGTWVSAVPNSDSAIYSHVEFLVSPGDRIVRLRVFHRYDGSLLEFNFSNESVNPPLSPALFTYKLPSGAQLVEDTQQ